MNLNPLKKPKTTSATIDDFDRFLTDHKCIILPYNVWLSNPTQGIVKSDSRAAFENLIKKQSEIFLAIIVVKKPIGSGRYNYIAFNQHVGYSLDV
jgi:hypothetical protein